jgi:hypothetical protein
LAALTQVWETSTWVISGFGVLALSAGLLVARSLSTRLDSVEDRSARIEAGVEKE